MKKAIINLLFIILSFTNVFAHSGKAKYHAVIDMDDTPSSMNALTMILANTEIEVLAVLTNSPETQNEVTTKLKGFYHDGIPVFEISDKEKAGHALREIFENEPDSISYLGLCGLKNVSLVMNLDDRLMRLSRVIAFDDEQKLKSKEKKTILSFLSGKNIDVDLVRGQVWLKDWENDLVYNPYAEALSKEYEKNGRQILLEKEFVPIFIKDNSKFVLRQSQSSKAQIKYYEFDDAKEDIKNLVRNSLNRDFSGENKVFSVFPQDKQLFAEDVQQIMDESMYAHGYSEWRAGVITNELHGHLGIYAVVGAKMGIRVREYFRIGVDDIVITSYAGKTPPFSCLNDGLQVSTGGTIGHGLIKVEESVKPKPAASFSFKNHKVYMELKPEYWEQVKKDIRYGVETYGLESENYWAYVRKLALKYWHDWDRHHIFIIN